jgi:hypothetical protein
MEDLVDLLVLRISGGMSSGLDWDICEKIKEACGYTKDGYSVSSELSVNILADRVTPAVAFACVFRRPCKKNPSKPNVKKVSRSDTVAISNCCCSLSCRNSPQRNL